MNGDIAAAYIDYAQNYLCDSLMLGFTTDGFGPAGSKSAHLVDEFKVWDTDIPEE